MVGAVSAAMMMDFSLVGCGEGRTASIYECRKRLTQQLMAELFQTTKQNISLHVQNIFEEGELLPEATVKEYLTVRQEGNRQVQRALPQGNPQRLAGERGRSVDRRRPVRTCRLQSAKTLNSVERIASDCRRGFQRCLFL
jgi:transcriptional regulator with AAA-type ATPase domain